MAEIKGFKGLRYNTEKAGEIETLCCPPYDIISDAQRLDYIKENEYNIIRLELPKGENPYNEAADILNNWLQNDILVRENKEAIYIYEQDFSAYGACKSVKGLICRVKIEEFSKGVVLPHEETLSKAKEDRLNLMKATNCNFSQIYSLYMDEEHKTTKALDELSKGEPDLCVTDPDNVTHKMWIITDEDAISSIAADFIDRKLYIADGHHRYETALNYRNYLRGAGKAKPGDACDYQMMALVDMQHEGLVVFPTHRLVRDLPSFDCEKAKKDCAEYFDIIEKTDVSSMEAELDVLFKSGKKAFGMYCGGDNYTILVLKDMKVINEMLPQKSEASRGLDVTVLHTLILQKLFKIDAENMAKQINLTYTKIFDEAIDSVKSGKSQCAFILNPTKVTEIRDVASAGEKMPQKSTYFYPKLITGFVVNQLQ
ncbi:MAG: DUF1015 domain-containing protein [Bacillota bacterium]|nr:DUF1015 domain-containing protein [Bacillota bacterium]